MRLILNILSGVECLKINKKIKIGEEEKVTGGQIG
jgi:hypothetical protein